ncbi:hypothetical protein RIF29_13656 [Crotalaria pallida]|uniref:Uncharacterized protein n=1 Tax=Crotalaria pallida TaxID=3830 RepID=A0AAN9P2G3_CROPI
MRYLYFLSHSFTLRPLTFSLQNPSLSLYCFQPKERAATCEFVTPSVIQGRELCLLVNAVDLYSGMLLMVVSV